MAGKSIGLALVVWLVGCEAGVVREPPPITGSGALVIVEEEGEAPVYALVAPGGAPPAASESARITVAMYRHTFAELELVDAAGEIPWATGATPTAQTAPLPTPVTWYVSDASAAFLSVDPAGWAQARPERVALSGCPTFDEQEIRLGVGGDYGRIIAEGARGRLVFTAVSGASVSHALRCGKECVELDGYPANLARPVAARDPDGVVWWFDGMTHLRTFAGGAVELPADVVPTGLVVDAGRMVVLDDHDRLHVRVGEGPWRAPLALASESAARACDRPLVEATLWLDGDRGTALLERSCRIVELQLVGDRVEVTELLGGGFGVVAYAQDRGVRAALVGTSIDRASLWVDGGDGRWAVVTLEAAPGLVGDKDAPQKFPTVAVIGGDVMTMRLDNEASILASHGWPFRPEVPRLACPIGDPVHTTALTAVGGALLSLKNFADSRLLTVSLER